MKDVQDISELLKLERELKRPPSLWARVCNSFSEQSTLTVERDAKLNLLKTLQVRTEQLYEMAYHELYKELDVDGKLEGLREITPDRSKDLLQPHKGLELQQELDVDTKLVIQLQVYLAEAELAKPCLYDLVKQVERAISGTEGRYPPEVKSLESTKRKAVKFCGKDVRKVADMARVALVCATPEVLLQAYRAIMARLQASEVYFNVF